MKNGGHIPWNSIPSCETFKISCLMGRLHTKAVLENLSTEKTFRLVHWLSITLSLRKTSQESINLERKSYLDCSLDTLCTRGELRSWKRWTHRKSTQKKAQCKGRFFSNKMENSFFHALYAGGIWKGDVLVAHLEELETMDASDINSQRLNAKEVIFPKEKRKFIFPIADGRIEPLGGDQDLRTSTLVRHRPIQGESNIDFLGESEGSLPPPHDSLPDAGEAMNDFWSMSGSFIYRHHVEPRVKLYSPREESFPIPLKYIDVTRTTHTNLDVKQEKRIDGYWNIDGSRDLSDPWTGFTQFTL